MRHHRVQFALGETIGLEMVGEEANRVPSKEDIATAADVRPRGIANRVLVDKRVLGEDGVAELMAAVIDLEVEIGVWVPVKGALQFAEGQVAVALIDIDLLQAEDVGIGLTEETYDVVIRRLARLPHAMGVEGEDSQ